MQQRNSSLRKMHTAMRQRLLSDQRKGILNMIHLSLAISRRMLSLLQMPTITQRHRTCSLRRRRILQKLRRLTQMWTLRRSDLRELLTCQRQALAQASLLLSNLREADSKQRILREK